ncbi:MAG TPA: hypothetical protein ENN75_01970 [candidate division Zixibacteria bacterium]|nr:hypothetical protein [candidate division Zixibacteria bacterium]
MPDAGTVLLIAPPASAFIILWSLLSGWLKTAKGLKTGYTRKIFHFGIFTMAGVLHIYLGLPAVVLFGVLTSAWVIFAVVRGEGNPFFEAIARETDRPRRSFFVIIPLLSTALGGVASNILFPGYAVVGYLVAGWGDAVAEPVGVRFGKHKYKVLSLGGVPAVRSIEGSLSVLIAGFFACLISLLIIGLSPQNALLISLAVAFSATVTEAISTHGLDNLTVQIVASGVAFYLSRIL